MEGKIRLSTDHQLNGTNPGDPFIQDEDKLTIKELIPRILQERKSFLNITEASLEQEIADLAHTDDSEEFDQLPMPKLLTTEFSSPSVKEDSNLIEEEAKNVLMTSEEIFKQKHELQQHIGIALNETSLSLDFVSLLLSGVRPNVAKSTISPHLTKTVPMGSLGADRLQEETVDGSKTAIVGQGWKFEALSKVTKEFKAALSKLEDQVALEHIYWNRIHTVMQNGEILCKLKDPTTGHRKISVKYGYGDSGSNFLDKGLAVLKNDALGLVSLLPVVNELTSRGGTITRLAEKVYKYIRIKILTKIDDEYMLTGQSLFNSASISDNRKEGIINDIEKARYFLFEEDLFHQLTREAKTLINYNVSIISNKIIIEAHNQIIEIESVLYDENNEEDLNNIYQNVGEESSMNNAKAQNILIFLKLMLCCFYKYNLELKRSVPTARTKWKITNSHPLILRPLLGHIRHEINVNNVTYVLQQLLSEYDSSKYEIKVNKYLDLQEVENTKRIQDIFEKSTKSPVSEITVKLEHPESNGVLKITIKLSATETFCNLIIDLLVERFDSVSEFEKNENGAKVVEVKVYEIYDVEECLQWVFAKFTNKS